MTKLYISLGVVGLFIFGIWYHIQVAEENAQLKIAIDSAANTIQKMDEDRQAKDRINQHLRMKREELEHEKARLVADLDKLPRTEVQRDCDAVATPDGYSERVFKFARGQGEVRQAGEDVAGTDAPVSGHEKP